MKVLYSILSKLFAFILAAGYLLAPVGLIYAAAPIPTCNITVTPTSINVGGSVTVKWTSTDATNGAITGIGNVSPSGSINLLPPSTGATYFGAFTGPGGTANCQASVTVNTGSGGSTTGTQTTTTIDPTTGLPANPSGTVTSAPLPPIAGTTAGGTGSGLVPCGYNAFNASNTTDSATGCQACNLADLIQNIITFAIGLSIPIAAALFAWAGVLFFTSADDPGKVSKAKQIFKNAFIGFVIAITAWIVINTVLVVIFSGSNVYTSGSWFTIQCATQTRQVSATLNQVLGTLNGSTLNTGGTPTSAGNVTYDNNGNPIVNDTQNAQTVANGVSDILQNACEDNGDATSCAANQTDIPSNGKLTTQQQDALGDLCDEGDTASCNALDTALALPANLPPPASGAYSSSIAAAAAAYQGTNTNVGASVDYGNKACAYAVNQVLQNAGIAPIGDGLSVSSMENALQNGRGVQEGQQSAQAGDVIVFGGMSHVGICQNDGCTSVISNSSANATFTSVYPPTPGSRYYKVTN